LYEKGFCVLKLCQDAEAVQKSIDALRDLGSEGRLGRLPQEVEEGYLGAGQKGKVIWLDPEEPDMFHEDTLDANDKNLSYLAQLIQPMSEDSVGCMIDERTPALVSLSLLEDEEDDFPFPMADDKTLGDFLGTWRRGLVRLVHFMGPGAADVTLESKGGPKATALPSEKDSCGITAEPNTIVIYRSECYNLSWTSSDEVLTMMASFLSEAPNFVLAGWEGDEKMLTIVSEGSPPPAGEGVDVMNVASRLGGSWDYKQAYHAGLVSGGDAVVEMPYNRFDIDFYYCDNPDEIQLGPPRTIQRHTSYVDGVEMFDNKYFEIMTAEAAAMDPLQRQVCEVGGNCMYMNGVAKKTANRTSHHAGCSVGLDKADFPTLGLDNGPSAGNNALAIIANRFSFTFNMKGPNYVCDTACSASLTATHLAKLCLLERTWDPLEWWIAVGTHLCLAPGPFIGCSMTLMISPQGRCFTFNASANGYLRGEGTSGMCLKFGKEDIKNKEAVYRASQCGQDGRSASLTAPNGPAQEDIITKALKEARMQPPESNVWECHGTGTSLGDPIEVGAIRKVMIRMDRDDPLMVTSNKTNMGHLEGGAAMAGMVASVITVLANTCCTALHLRELNPHLEHSQFDFWIETELTKFPHEQGQCHISSFGFGGSNGHAIFWGQAANTFQGSTMELIMKRIKKLAPPEVRPVGDDPGEWESDFFEADMKAGDKYTITMRTDDPKDMPLKWVKKESAPDEEDADEDVAFCITGNFNSWEDDRMMPGDAKGQHMVNVIVPSDGKLEFRFLQDGDADLVIAPDKPECTKKTTKIVGPKAGLKNSWLITAEPDTEFQVELMVLRGEYSVLWFRSE
jgi:polyketide synthase-associated protein